MSTFAFFPGCMRSATRTTNPTEIGNWGIWSLGAWAFGISRFRAIGGQGDGPKLTRVGTIFGKSSSSTLSNGVVYSVGGGQKVGDSRGWGSFSSLLAALVVVYPLSVSHRQQQQVRLPLNLPFILYLLPLFLFLRVKRDKVIYKRVGEREGGVT